MDQWMELQNLSKGDAITLSILVLAINIMGGLIVGISQYNLPVSTAAENDVLLSIGDGLVAQDPILAVGNLNS